MESTTKNDSKVVIITKELTKSVNEDVSTSEV